MAVEREADLLRQVRVAHAATERRGQWLLVGRDGDDTLLRLDVRDLVRSGLVRLGVPRVARSTASVRRGAEFYPGSHHRRARRGGDLSGQDGTVVQLHRAGRSQLADLRGEQR